MLRLAVITDIHSGSHTGNKYGNKAPRLIELFVKAVNSYNPDLVIEMGDRISGKNKNKDRKDMRRLKTLFNKLSVPAYHIIGNHDVKNLTRKDNEEIMECSSKSYSMDAEGFHIVFWNPNVDCYYKSGLYLEEGDLEWLKENLSANSELPTIVFSHVPLDDLINPNAKETDTNEIAKRFAYPEGPDIRKVLEDAGNVILCMAGHRHTNASKNINGIHYVTLQSLVQAQQGYRKRSPYGTYAFVEISINDGSNDNDVENMIHIELKGKFRKTYDLPYGEKPTPNGP